MSQLWIDLTDLRNWGGHMTGIQRLVYNVARYYANDGRARFFIYTPNVGFSEVDFNSVVPAKLKGELEEAESSLSPQPSTLKHIGARVVRKNLSLAKRTAKFVYRRSPRPVQLSAKRLYMVLRPGEDVLKINHSLKHPFAAGDVVFLPGASWHLASQIANLGYLKDKVGFKIVHVIYDMIPELFPQFFGQGFGDVYVKHMFNVFAISDHLLAISKNTKKDSEAFQDRMLLPKAPVSVIRLGDSPYKGAAKKSPDPKIKPKGFILVVGTLEIRKNYLLLYYIWRRAYNLGKKLPKLVVVGQHGWLSSDSMYLMHFDPAVRDSIVVLQDSGDKDLAWLYQNCLFTIWPSWYEGWGLPVAESLNYGKLCISSNSSSMPEIAGDLIPYFDPFDTVGAAELVVKYAEDPKALAAAEAKIKKGYKPVGWDRAYTECRKVTDSLLTKPA